MRAQFWEMADEIVNSLLGLRSERRLDVPYGSIASVRRRGYCDHNARQYGTRDGDVRYTMLPSIVAVEQPCGARFTLADEKHQTFLNVRREQPRVPVRIPPLFVDRIEKRKSAIRRAVEMKRKFSAFRDCVTFQRSIPERS